MVDEWKKIEPGVWKPENKGDSIIGALISKEPKDENVSAKYHVEDTNGDLFLVWGSAILDNRLQHVKIGQKIKIVYNGKTKNQRGQDLNLYEVAVAKSSAPSQIPRDVDFKSASEPVPVEDIL